MEKQFDDAYEAMYFLKGFARPELQTDGCVTEYNNTVKEWEVTSKLIEYAGPRYTADMVRATVPNKDALIMDLCSGTGYVGAELVQRGYKNIDCQDGAQGMLDVCMKMGIYRKSICCLINEGEQMPIEDGTYDVVAVSGGTCLNHLPPTRHTQAEILRIIKPGGFFITTYRQNVTEIDYGKSWRNVSEQLEEEGKWKLYGRLQFPKYHFKMDGIVDIYQVL